MDVSLWQRERMFYESNELMSHGPMGQIWKNKSFGRNNKIFQCVHFMIHSDPRHERRTVLRNS